MPIPSFTETIGSALGPGITVIQGGDFFAAEGESDTAPLDIAQMNSEISFSSKDDRLVFMEHTPQDEDLPLRAFLSAQKEGTSTE